ncbi:hypothetical protein [Falsiroseomonas sp.]|uniref:hypothetical protein n=1 Tax=Falsiroseomonas sp. TaxID=2870721 RepID=UPI003F6E70A0
MRWFDRKLALLLGRYFGLTAALRIRDAALPLVAMVLLLQVVTTALDAGTDLLKMVLKDAWLVVAPLALLALIGLIAWRVPKASQQLAPRVEREEKPRPVACLVLLLSPLGNPASPDPKRRATFEEAAAQADSFRGDIADPKLLDNETIDRHVWAMAIAAMRPHLARLRRVVVVCSADAEGQRGTIHDYERFQAMLARIWPAAQQQGAVVAAHRVPGLRLPATLPGPDGQPRGFDPRGGVDAEDMHELVALLHALLERLRDEFGGDEEVLVDVTGQRKVATAAAVALAVLVPGRRFQYVNERKHAFVYDVTVDLAQLRG